MSVKKINAGQVRFHDPIGVIFLPWTGENGAIGYNGYDIHDIVGDTFSLTQDDAERTEIPWEFGDDPLDENVKLGARKLAMQCLDFQNDIMTNIFGWEKDDNGDFVYAPVQYKDLYCTIILQFEDKCVVMSKVKMDSKAVLENLRSDIARGEINGVLYATDVIFGSANAAKETAIFFVKNGKNFTIGETIVSISAEGIVSISPKQPEPESLTLSFAAAGEAKTYTADDAIGTITVIDGAAWVTSSVSDKTVTFTAAANTDTTPRTTSVAVKAEGTTIAAITISQEGATPAPEPPAPEEVTMNFSHEADSTGQTYTATDATGTVTATSSEQWATTSVDNNVVTVTVTANEGDSTRTATVTVKEDNNTIAVITVSQTANA